MKHLKGQGLSFNTIIVAILALVVLVVLVIIFTGRSEIFFSTLQDCDSKPGSIGCRSSCDEGYGSIPGTECDDNDQLCCVKIFPGTSSP